MSYPQHLAIIMDGNGRWAEQRRLPRIAGHRRGVETVQEIVKECRSLGIPHLTLYAFSSENWGRPHDEVGALMELLGLFLKRELQTMLANDIRLKVIGEVGRLPGKVREILEQTVSRTAANSGMVLTLALSYGARNELLRAVRDVAEEVRAGRVEPEAIDESCFAGHLDTAELPDPDFLIRTSGEMRISNFLLWQLAYAELYFTEALWPDFSSRELHRALEEFGRRQRRFGLTGAQVQKPARRQGEKNH
ncbi:MAG: isoprenyl transferase [Desulfuromonas sp.]|uniref:isoprenyl transferase n=1 Tax=Desulfuromonas sp. TaxID=892 RepID=UPI000CC0FF83|nr:isoprenyl transferase [Desulfuromonas sp.]PLX85090.1 MAG: isoprenyl transferase [Desulfuromonas sp.]